MPPSGLIGALNRDGTFHARHLQRASPDRAVADLRTIWATTFHADIDATRAALLRYDWALLCPSCHHQRPPAGTFTVAGVGHAVRHNDQATHGHPGVTERHHAPPEWMYLLNEPTGEVLVYEASVHGRWLLHSRHRLDPRQVPQVISCGGHTGDGHGWQPARVTLLGSSELSVAAYDAELCAGRHPRGLAIARFTDATADIIAADSQAGTAPWGARMPVLHRDGAEFDLTWGSVRARVARDQDDRLLIGAHLLPWQLAETTQWPQT